MKLQALFLSTLGFGLLAAAAPDPDACGDLKMPPPVDKLTCGDSLSDLGCKWSLGDSDFIACIQQCRREKGLNRYIWHNHRYYDISVAEYDEIMKAEEKPCAAASDVTVTATKTVAAIKATNKAGVHHTGKKTEFETVFRTVTHDARQPSVETGLAATHIDHRHEAADPADETAHHPRLDHYCQKTSQVALCRVECGIHIFGGFDKCMKKCHKKCHKKHPLFPDGEDTGLVKRAEDEESQHPRVDLYCTSEFQNWKYRQSCAHHITPRGFKKCVNKRLKKCSREHPLHPDGEVLIKRADNDTVFDATTDSLIDITIDAALDEEADIANATDVVKRSDKQTVTHVARHPALTSKSYCSSYNVQLGCKLVAQFWPPAYDTIFNKCIKRCIERHGVD